MAKLRVSRDRVRGCRSKLNDFDGGEVEEGRGAGLFLRGDCWSLRELACKGIGASVIKEAEKMGGGGACHITRVHCGIWLSS